MKTLILVSVVILLPLWAISQGNYGYGSIAIKNPIADGFVSKTIYVSRVLNLDSIVHLPQYRSLKRSERRNHFYSRCINQWLMTCIVQSYPDSLAQDSEVIFVPCVELVSDWQRVNIKRLDDRYQRENRRKRSKFLTRSMAQSKRQFVIEVGNRDKHATMVEL